MNLVESIVLEHRKLGTKYREMVFGATEIASEARPGQFVHMRVPRLSGAVLRRPFSIYRAEEGSVSVIYKTVGKGTEAMTRIEKGENVSLLGPLGNGFPWPASESMPVLVAGGYGIAPLAFLARRLDRAGIAFIGGAEAGDVLCRDELENAGWDVRVATEDGSMGRKGLVTALFETWLQRERDNALPEVYACGPDGMLQALAAELEKRQLRGWLSLDRHMGCGMGACLACVQKIRLDDGGAVLKRACRDGPVFEAGRIVW